MTKVYDFFYNDQKRKYVVLLAAFGGAHIFCLPYFNELSDESYIGLVLGAALLLTMPLVIFYSIVENKLQKKGVLEKEKSGFIETKQNYMPTYLKSTEENLSRKSYIDKIPANKKQISSQKIFISYATDDKPFAHQLANMLQAAGAVVFIDFNEYHIGDNLSEQINKALHSSDKLLLLWSTAASKSHWVRLEWENALALKKTIIQCSLDRTPLPPVLKKEKRHINIKPFFNTMDELMNALSLDKK
jgi:hypothetical protein